MANLKLLDFGGEIPSRSPRLLPDSNSVVCETAWLSEAGLDTFPLPSIITSLHPSTRYVYRIPLGTDITDYSNSFFKEFVDPDTKMIKAPVSNDSYERYYWSVPGADPQYNTKARIIAGEPDYVLGLPLPTSAPIVEADGSGTGEEEVRAYLFTYVTEYGEEGPASPTATESGKIDDIWNITLPEVGLDANQRNITKRRIYRTITGTSGSTTFYFVDEIPIQQLAYADDVPGTEVAGNTLLASTVWTGPPAGLQGLINMPNGIVAGFINRDVWFSEPYRPHAWPVEYSVTVEHPIIGLGVISTSLVVLTSGFPTAITGIHPDSMAQTKHPYLAPCVSAGSIISGPDGVLFAGPDGLMLAASGQVQVLTMDVIAKRRWQKEYQPKTIRAVWNKEAFMSMPSSGSAPGFLIHLSNPRKAIIKIPMPQRVGNLLSDPWTGEPMFIMNSSLYIWDSGITDARLVYRWVSKEFHHPKPVTYAALKIYFDGIPLNSQSDNVDPWASMSLALLPKDVTGQLKLYADRNLVWTRNFSDKVGELMRLPSGYKAEVFQLEVISRVRVDSVQLASSARELQAQ